jgi:hypothetical protein
MLLKSIFSMMIHDQTQVWKYRKQSQNLDGQFFTHYSTQILLLQISTTLDSSVERLGSDDKVLEEVK